MKEIPIGRVISVAGPTASGKSRISIALAQHLHSEILCCDAVQVFQGADIGSAKLGPEDQMLVPHHGLDLVSVEERMDAARFVEMVEPVLKRLLARTNPILCVGSTLYYEALMYGLTPLAKPNRDLRKALEAKTTQELQIELTAIDPQRAAVLHKHDRKRLLRALEICLTTSRTTTEVYEEHQGSVRERCPNLVLVLCLPRSMLYSGIDARTHKMLESGLVKEADALARASGWNSQIFEAIGYRECKASREGSLASDRLEASIAQNTRRFAKRQMTFWRQEPTRRGIPAMPSQLGEKAGQREFSTLDLSFSELCQRVQSWLYGSDSRSELWYINAAQL